MPAAAARSVNSAASSGSNPARQYPSRPSAGACSTAGWSVDKAALAVRAQHGAGFVAAQVHLHGDAAALELAAPVGGQGAFVETGQRLHVVGARADQHLV